uniref:Uncharacterized protein n=1 Tax=Helianthus annuus TaxID=4232 RepID=A0A251U878_HELAN
MEVVEAVTAWRCYGGGGFSGDVGVRWWRRGGCVMLGRFSDEGGRGGGVTVVVFPAMSG